MLRFVLALFLSIPVFAQVPIYQAGRTLDTIRVDGKLDEFTWAALPRVGRFTNIRQADQSTAAPTEAVVAWDDTNLYVAFASIDPMPWGTMYKRDSRIWEEEVVEVFLDPDGDGQNYPELEVSPHNVVVDLLIPRRGGASGDAIKWDIAGLRTAVSKHAAGWAAEIAIPWAALEGAGIQGKPNVGDKWRVGLYRIERPGDASKGRRAAGLRAKLGDANAATKKSIMAEIEQLHVDTQWLVWSPTRVEYGFHDPERFGTVEFVLKPQAPSGR
jgi:hypothetical protein